MAAENYIHRTVAVLYIHLDYYYSRLMMKLSTALSSLFFHGEQRRETVN